jgi:hypothetical protein
VGGVEHFRLSLLMISNGAKNVLERIECTHDSLIDKLSNEGD